MVRVCKQAGQTSAGGVATVTQCELEKLSAALDVDRMACPVVNDDVRENGRSRLHRPRRHLHLN